MTITIYHNPNCGTSRNVLAMLRDSGEAPEVDPAEEAKQAERHDEGEVPPPDDRPIGEVHAMDDWDDDAEDLLR